MKQKLTTSSIYSINCLIAYTIRSPGYYSKINHKMINNNAVFVQTECASEKFKDMMFGDSTNVVSLEYEVVITLL